MKIRARRLAVAIGTGMAVWAGSSGAWFTPSIGACGTSSCQVVSSSSGNLSAQAVFEVVGSNVFVTLINTSSFDVVTPADVLTSLLFNLNYNDGSAVSLSAVSALMSDSAGSVVDFDARTIDQNLAGKVCEGAVDVVGSGGCTASDNVGGEWNYAAGAGVGSVYTGFSKGIGSAGLGVFGNANFGGPNLEGPAGVNGGQYGITSAGDNPNTDINGNGYNPETQNAVQFKLAITPAVGKTLDLTASGALSAGFQYGTSTTDPFLTPIPGTLPLLGLGIAGLWWTSRRKLA